MADSRSRKRREVAPSFGGQPSPPHRVIKSIFGREGESRKPEKLFTKKKRKPEKLKSGAESSTAELSDLVEDKPARLNQDEVILSYVTSDSLIGFVGSLRRCLEADGIRVFRVGDLSSILPEELRRLVSGSNIYIPIFSTAYARSVFCLETLALMVEHTSRSGGKKVILPVFYDVERSDVQPDQKSRYRDALDVHKQEWGDEKVKLWAKALVEAGKVKGWELSSYKSEEELITAIVGEILFKLMIEHNYVSEDLSTGDNPMLSDRTSELEVRQESKIMELLELEVKDVRIVGIHGRDGIGKTTLAKIVYDQISLLFDARSFLAEIEVTTQQPGGVQYLQTKLIFDILKREYEVASAFKGVRFLKEILRNMKVLLVLDDVERLSILKQFIGAKLDWFGSGSRIIVTSKEKSVLQGFVDRGVAHTYDVSPMDDNRAFNFFWQYAAIGKSDELRSYVKIAIEIVKAAKGLPLLLKIFGSFLHDKGLEEWIKFEDLIQQFHEDYQKILSRIYEALNQKQKQMYLDIARCTRDVDCRIASYMWHHYDRPHDEIEVLRRTSLIQMEENKIGMHGMLRCLPAIAQDTNKGKKGTDHLNTEEAGFEILRNTTFLSLGRTNVGAQFADVLLNVRWLHWQGCPRDAISIHLEKNENLVILDLSWSKVTESWGDGALESLESYRLCGLISHPRFSCCPNLEILILERCSRLVHLDPSINDLKLLVTLNLKFCSELNMLPMEMDGMNALRELLIDGTSVRELPTSIGKLFRLEIISATNCFSLVCVPGSVCELKALRVLALDDAKLLNSLDQ
ncbi:TMV resistance protein N-like [Eucalyptus grandis]|uniref:TMV resistance protein N-like n=1 Tax=Eucalyptus grandis TaxID=71139 RepID=UPI00192EB9D6|nr:TMV resistance protein N-like [Eucalyptus grandis]